MLTRRTVILAKIETTYGTDPTPTATADAVLVSNPQVRVIGERLERDFVRSSLSPLEHVIGMKEVEVTFSTELKGSGTAGTASEVSPLWRACGMAETIVASPAKVTYDPVSTAFESCTIYVYRDGMIYKINGCRGTVELVAETGKFGLLNWNFKGLYQIPVDGAIVSGTFDTTKPPSVVNIGFTMHTYAAIIRSLQIALNNTVSRRESANAVEGVVGFEITARGSNGSVDPETVIEATHAFWTKWKDGTAAAIVATIGATAGNKIQLDAPKVQYNELGWGNRDGVMIYDIPLSLAQNAGDDEVKITYL